MAVITLPGVIISLADAQALDNLMRRFGNARRRAFSLKRQGGATTSIETLLQHESYAEDSTVAAVHVSAIAEAVGGAGYQGE
jgi:hypothetical protein